MLKFFGHHIRMRAMCRRQRLYGRNGAATLVVVLLTGCTAAQNEYQPPPPPPVTVAKPVQRSVPVYIEENGETEVVERAEVRARVTGFLKEVNFEPGDQVAKDVSLYIIEPDQYEATKNAAAAAVEAAQAAIEVAQAQVGTLEVELERARKDYERQENLKQQDATTQQAYDAAVAAFKASQANVEAAKANVQAANSDRNQAKQDLAQAELNLGYTAVTAPISGRITKTEVKVGNLVQEGTHLATIVNRSRIYANFNLSDREVLVLKEAAVDERKEQGVEEPPDLSQIRVRLHREIDAGFPFEGHLDYIDQEGVDQATGTLSLRAVFDNPDDRLLPGLFVRVRVKIDEIENAVLIPELALARDQQGAYVQVLDQTGKLARRGVVTGPSIDATPPDGESSTEDGGGSPFGKVLRMVVIEEGVDLDDRVVIAGGFGIRPGAEVDPTEISLDGISLLDVGEEEADGPEDGEVDGDEATTAETDE
ncbi:MAG: efflux RND transporter periplasmic adaptor subunit [Planctomycetota bacterium]|nr:MAG: efflux RND transporter periplasmic adaptor subunit [Planctomycetota bacterium]REJ97080.1 MAG: efflux RND transporter periplasmic adaptor subunit [Planctomycetota bacterium]REK20569.1 MAG: efflux RND transporter periplasmic adaptor subunit [Planctomycetota bacterium]REK35106.1 MAG: efflux RND transporter periplasmic adaptor subunit [Planctomycetota bacterium]